jgi:hypothetical protein
VWIDEEEEEVAEAEESRKGGSGGEVKWNSSLHSSLSELPTR